MRGPWAAQEALGMTWKDGVEEGREAQEGGDACTDLNYHTAKANTTFKKKKKKDGQKLHFQQIAIPQESIPCVARNPDFNMKCSNFKMNIQG